MLNVDNLHVTLGKNPVLTGFSCQLATGRIGCLLGPNGSGKTTLLRSLLGMQAVQAGQATWMDQNLLQCNEVQRSRTVAYIPQDSGKASRLCVFDAVLLGRRPFFGNRPRPADLEKCHCTMDTLGISGLALRTLDTLSGGQRQLVWIAKAVCQDSPLILLDEPTSNLDLLHTLEVGKILRLLAGMGRSLLVVSHDWTFCKNFCDEVILLQQGRCTLQKPTGEMPMNAIAQLYEIDQHTLENYW